MDDVRKMELIAMSENEASKLNLSERYDRIRLVRQKIGMETIKNYKSFEKLSDPQKTSPRASNEPIAMYNHWTNDK